jgi:hypothetical protein
VAHNDLQTIEVDFLSNSNNILQQAVIAIQQEQSTVDEQITQIKELAHAANEDISSCTDIREELLSRLPGEYNEMLRNCILERTEKRRELWPMPSTSSTSLSIKFTTWNSSFVNAGMIFCASHL